MAYHLKTIEKGVLGEFSKIKEEFLELEDAFEQQDKILMICEFTDLIGAIEVFIGNNYNLKISDLKTFSDKTQKAFIQGKR